MTIERRQRSRVRVSFALDGFSLFGEDEVVEGRGLVKDITTSGLMLTTTCLLKKNDLVQLPLALPGESKILNMEGRVCWVQGDGNGIKAGLEFMDLSLDQRERIDNYLQTMGTS